MSEKTLSLPEKQILCEFIDESAPLPYKTSFKETSINTLELVYEIPGEKKEEVLKQLWPFTDCPAMDDVMYDLHEEECFTVRDFIVIRWNGRNLLASPYYLVSGGMCVDWLKPEAVEEVNCKIVKGRVVKTVTMKKKQK